MIQFPIGLRRVHHAGIFGQLAHGADPVRCERVGPKIGISARAGQDFLIAEILEEFDDPAGRLTKLREVFDCRGIGRGLFRTRVREEVQRSKLL